MNNWKEYKLNDLVTKLGDGLHGTPKYNPNGDYYFINGSNLIKGKISVNDNTKRVTKEEFDKYKKELTDRTIFVSINGTLGNIATYNNEKVVLGKSACYFNVKEDVSKEFIKYIVSDRAFQHYIYEYATGTTIKNVPLKAIREYTFKLPDLSTQTAIAEILSSLDDKIELNNKINQELENLAQTLFKQWFIDFEFPNEKGEPYKSSGGEMVDSELGEIPKGWGVGTLNDLIDFSNGNAFKSNELLNENTGDCYHVFKMGHIKKGGGLNADGTKSYYEKNKAKKLDKYVLRVGDLLMCMTDMKGNVALLGHTALMNENDKYIVNQRVGLLRPNNDLGIDFPYLYILTNSNDFIEDLRSRANSGVQVNLSTSEIKSSKVLLPPKFINIEFDNCIKPFFETIFNNTSENQELTNLRDTLLPKLISGEIKI